MSQHESASVDGERTERYLELVTTDEETWTAVPRNVGSVAEYQGQWISAEADSLRDLEAWR